MSHAGGVSPVAKVEKLETNKIFSLDTKMRMRWDDFLEIEIQDNQPLKILCPISVS